MADPTLLRTPVTQSNLLGLLLMTGGFFAFSAADVLAKILAEDYHPIQVVWIRQLGLLAGVLVLVAMQGPGVLRTRAPGWQVLRGVAAITSGLAFVFAISYVPLAEVVAVTFVAPFLVTMFGALLLGEAVGIRRWSAIAVGFLGTLIIIRPGVGAFHPAILLALVAAAGFAFRQVISRRLGASEPTVTTVAFTAGTAMVLLLVPMLFVWRSPLSGQHVALMTALTVLAGVGELLIIRALEVANAVVVAPMHYSLILFGTFWGFVVFGDLPDAWTWVGAAIVTLAGLYTLHRELRTRS